MSHSRRNHQVAETDMMSRTQDPPWRASCTDLDHHPRRLMKGIKAGANSPIALPSIQRSVQKRVDRPSPTVVVTKIWNIALTTSGIFMLSIAQGLSGRVFFCQHHLIRNAHDIISKFRILRPPRCSGRVTLNQDTGQCPPFTTKWVQLFVFVLLPRRK